MLTLEITVKVPGLERVADGLVAIAQALHPEPSPEELRRMNEILNRSRRFSHRLAGFARALERLDRQHS